MRFYAYQFVISSLLAVMLVASMTFAEPEIIGTAKEGVTAKSITWDDATTSVATDISPDTDTAINVFRATNIWLSCSTLTVDDMGGTGNLSTNVDVNILGSADCSNYDTTPYITSAISAMGDNKQISAAITSGSRCMKLRADNNAGGTLDLTCRWVASWE